MGSLKSARDVPLVEFDMTHPAPYRHLQIFTDKLRNPDEGNTGAIGQFERGERSRFDLSRHSSDPTARGLMTRMSGMPRLGRSADVR